MPIAKPTSAEHAPYYQKYIDLVPTNDLMTALEDQKKIYQEFVTHIPVEKLEYRYDEGKWTIKELLVHINDTERIYGYRALSFARGNKLPIPGFDENVYAANSHANKRSLEFIASEWLAVREATIALFKSFDEATTMIIGNANKLDISIRSIGYIAVGHTTHHLGIVKSRYL